MSTTILVVDDDPQILRLVRSYLEQAGLTVVTVQDGDDVLPAIRAHRPDLVVLDLMLPGKDGIEITRSVRQDPALAELPIVMLTARVDDIDRILGLEIGADDYITKPFNPREVLARVKAVLRRTQTTPVANAAPPVHIGAVRVDPIAHQAEADGKTLNLTPSEFAILHLLIREAGRAYSRTQLVEDGLGYDYAGLERTVDSHIKNLRRKLERDPARPERIETVFGVGYRYNPQAP